ncbi:MAG: AMP-binding protein [Clostridia bacterium]|nr:AMP-binding protein [Clostridia bacterium]
MKTIQTVEQLLQHSITHFASKDFCRFLQNNEIKCKTYQQFFDDCMAMCRYIRENDDTRKHIAFVGKTNYEYIVCLTSIILNGNVAVPFAPDISVSEAVQLFADADVSMLFCEEDFLGNANLIKQDYPQLNKILSLGDSRWYEQIFRTYAVCNSKATNIVNPDDCAMIIFTSGTTGNRKGVMLSNKNLAHNSTYDTYRMEDDDVSFSILPMHHVFCYACDVLKTMYDGGTLCLNGNLADLYKNLLIFEPTIMRIVPAVCKSMLTKIKIIEKRNPQLSKREAAERIVGKNFKRMIAGSAFLSAAIIDEFEKYGICARQGYGMSECSPRITTSDFSDVCKYSNGILLGIDEVRVVDGEIQVKGDSVMCGYYKKPQETANMFTSDGFLQTGDLGYIDDGHVYLIGRKKNLIILSNGENISPEEIENRFADYPLVREILVFADGDNIVAEIFPNAELYPNLTTEETETEISKIVDEVNIAMPSDRQIQSFRIRNTPFARTSTGKIKRTSFYYADKK